MYDKKLKRKMVYSIKISLPNKNGSGFIECLKVGYTGDETLDPSNIKSNQRLSFHYRNYKIDDVISVVPSATVLEESLLLNYLRDHGYSYDLDSEFFILNQDVLDFVKSLKTVDDIMSVCKFHYRVPKEYLNDILQNLSANMKEEIVPGQYNNIKDRIDNGTVRNIYQLVNNLGLGRSEVVYKNISMLNAMREAFKNTELNKFCQFTKKVHTICSNPLHYYSSIDLIPREILNYVRILGLKKVSKLKNKREFEKEFHKHIDNEKYRDKLVDRVELAFRVGYEYTFVDIKTKLRSVYNRLGLVRKPKATTIKEFFEVKTNRTGFKILSAKKNVQ